MVIFLKLIYCLLQKVYFLLINVVEFLFGFKCVLRKLRVEYYIIFYKLLNYLVKKINEKNSI